MRNILSGAFIAVALVACAAQTTEAPAPQEPPAPISRREVVARELVASGCAMPDVPSIDGELGVVAAELNARYRENEAGFMARDPDRVMVLRHSEFHTILPDGTVNSREFMYDRTRRLIGRVEQFDCVYETITALTLEGDAAHATVDQRTVRKQRFPDGTLHDIRTWVEQRESWERVDGVWMMWRVDQIQPGITVDDGVLVPPNP